jgi:hypothetical protein
MPYPEQREHEEFAAKKLVCLSGENFRFDRRGNDSGEPDVLFSGACILGVEITFVSYQGDADKPDFWVKDIWDFARNPQFDQNGIYRTIDPKTRKPKILDNQIERLTCFCQRQLDKKCSKQYSGTGQLWLGIYAYAPITESHEFDEIAAALSIPTRQRFDRIFIIHRIVGGKCDGYRALQIFPEIAVYS